MKGLKKIWNRDYFEQNGYTEYKTEVKGIQIFISPDKRYSVFFLGKSRIYSKMRHYKSDYTGQLHMMLEIDQTIYQQFQINQKSETKKAEEKIQAQKYRAEIQIGDVFNTHWGYDNTYVDFFQVVGRKSASKVIVQQIAKETTQEHMFSAHVKPIPNQFIDDPKIVTINKYGNLVKVDDYEHNGYKTDITREHYTSWGN